MRILQLHNYHQVRGGSDIVFDETISVLRAAGQDVRVFTRDNCNIRDTWDRVEAGLTGLGLSRAAEALGAQLLLVAPDVVHAHNLYPLIPPAILESCRRTGAAVVLRLADHTLICPTSHSFRDGRACEDCFGGREYNCVLNNCRGAPTLSIAYALRTALARARRTFISNVDLFVTPSEFLRQQYIKGGFNPRQLRVIHNFVRPPETGASPARGAYAAYLGRLSAEKGVCLLLRAARLSGVPVVFAGDASGMRDLPREDAVGVRFVGPIARSEVMAFLGQARFLVVPSLCPESFGLSCAEAMACGVPPLAARIGALPELITDMEDGVLFSPGSVTELADRMREMWNDDDLVTRLGRAARQTATSRYGVAAHVRNLVTCYEEARELRCAS